MHKVRLRHRTAFTLVEVTISVAMALVLMLGIAQVFRISGDAVGSGQAMSDALRSSRAAQVAFSRDFSGALSSGAPFMTLFSNQLFAYRNRADMLADKDQNASTADLIGSGTETILKAAQYNARSHRTDTFQFFSRGFFHRQTGAQVPTSGTVATGPLVADMTSTESLLWYGHLKFPDNTGAVPPQNPSNIGPTNPGATSLTTNPYNYFADDWILGRVQTLLSPSSTVGPNGATYATPQIVDNNGNQQFAYCATNNTSLAPLTEGSTAYKSSTPSTAGKMTSSGGIGTTTVQNDSCRIDLAATSIGSYYSLLRSYIYPNGTPPAATGNALWFNKFFCSDTNRYWYFPLWNAWQSAVKPRPINQELFAYQTPVFVPACTQFIVEYAGDYLNQDPTSGAITDTYVHITGTPGTTAGTQSIVQGTTDGVVDFFVDANGVHQIRWYGMPRSTTSNSTLKASNGDVVPLRDSWIQVAAAGSQAPFEMKLPITTVPTAATDYFSYTAAFNPYTCAWSPIDRLPKMIRITMTIDDPQGRLGDGQTYEYIFTLQ